MKVCGECLFWGWDGKGFLRMARYGTCLKYGSKKTHGKIACEKYESTLKVKNGK